jgi:REP element-mobilizing transposase RayT
VAEGRYAKNAGVVFSLRYQRVWCPKYRRPVLGDAVAEPLRDAGSAGHVSERTVRRYIAEQRGR